MAERKDIKWCFLIAWGEMALYATLWRKTDSVKMGYPVKKWKWYQIYTGNLLIIYFFQSFHILCFSLIRPCFFDLLYSSIHTFDLLYSSIQRTLQKNASKLLQFSLYTVSFYLYVLKSLFPNYLSISKQFFHHNFCQIELDFW